MKSLALSLIILAYNEEAYLKKCLESVAIQNPMPDEVIVVDNNSTDKTAEIARSFPFVRLINESEQGMTPARNAGFRAAKGDILARIDADSRLSPDWTQRLLTIFAEDRVMATTGPAVSITLDANIVPRSRLWSLVYFWATDAEFGIPILLGANMALRKSAWQKIAADTCPDDTKVHEDQDLSYLLAGKNLYVKRDNNLTVTIDGQSYHSWEKLNEYVWRRFRTRQYHTKRRTLQSTSQRLPMPKRLVYGLLVIIPSLVFLLTSIVLVPLRLVFPHKPLR